MIFSAPLWVWLALAALFGAATLWVYWRCYAAENRQLAEAALADRERQLEVTRNALGESERRRAELEGGALPEGLDAAARAAAEEDDASRRRAWALDGALRRVLLAARAGQSVEPALEDALRDAADNGVDLGDAFAADPQAAEASAAAFAAVASEPPAETRTIIVEQPTSADAAREGRLRDRLRRALAAARDGDAARLDAIEAETEADDGAADGGRFANLARSVGDQDLIGDGALESLAYRNWVLSTRISALSADLRAGREIDPDLLEAETRAALRRPDADRRDAAANRELAAIADQRAAAEAQADAAGRTALQETLADARDEASGLRYRNWMLARRLGDTLAALRSGAVLDPDKIAAELDAQGAPARPGDAGALAWAAAPMALVGASPEPAPAPPETETIAALRLELDAVRSELRGVEAAGQGAEVEAVETLRAAWDDAARLRERLAQAESGLREARAAEISGSEDRRALLERAGKAEAAAVRAKAAAAALNQRLWSARQRLAALTTGRQTAENRAEDALGRLRAAADEAAAMRGKLSGAENALRDARAALAEAPDKQEAETLHRRAEALDADLAGARAEAAAAAAAANAARTEAREAQDAGAAELARLRQRETDLLAALSAAESAADGAAKLAASQRAAAAEAPLRAELETLRLRLRQMEAEAADGADADAARRARAEISTLRTRLALAEAETERLRARTPQSSEAAGRRAPALPPPLVAPPVAAPRSRPVSAAEVLARGAGRSLSKRQRPFSGAAPVAPFQPSSEDAQSVLADVEGRPLTGVEAAARELIDSGAVVAVSSNTPKMLTAEPEGGPADDLTLLSSVSPHLQETMNAFGLFYFSQIAEMGPQDLAWLDDRLGLRGEVVRGRWSLQAQRLARLKASGAGGAAPLANPPAVAPLAAPGVTGPAAAPVPAPQNEAGAPAGNEAALVVGPAPDAEAVARLREGARDETVDTLPPHPGAVDVNAPMSGAEAAALELIESPSFTPGDFERSLLAQSPDDPGDDFQMIRGVGPNLDALLKIHGVRRYAQLAELTPREIAWLDRALGFSGRIVRDRWIPQARRLAERQRLGGRGPSGGGGSVGGRSEGADGRDGGASAAALAPILEAMEARSAQRRDARDQARAQARRLGEESGAPGEPPSIAAPSGFARPADAAGLGPVDGGLQTGSGGGRAAPPDIVDAAAIAPPIASPLAGAPSFGRRAFARQQTGAVETEALALLAAETGAAAPARPRGALQAPSDGAADDLKLIRAVGPKLEARLNELGVYYFRQLAAVTAQELVALDAALGLKGRTMRERWVAQAADYAERKLDGEMEIGGEGSWTLPNRSSELADRLAALRAAPLDAVEREALRLINAGFEAGAANRPAAVLDGPAGVSPDDLKSVLGVGAHLEERLNEIGVYYFAQIAEFSATDLAWVDARLRLGGKAVRDRWIAQAEELHVRRRDNAV